jgi:DNA invertase Pin-like site-specific DNA recombinase
MKTDNKFIAYYRVSTKKQGNDGLGMDGQRKVVRDFLNGQTVLAEFSEVESGKNAKRPQILKAIELCRKENATLVIAKIDRLARSVSFVSTLRDSGVKFIACDNPNATNFFINMLAAFAEEEARIISERVKLALTEKRERLKKHGLDENWRKGENQKWNDDARAKAIETNKEKAKNNLNTKRAKGYAWELRRKGTLQEAAEKLNKVGFVSPNGKKFHKTTVWRMTAKKDFDPKNQNAEASEPKKGKKSKGVVFEIPTDTPIIYRRAKRTHEPKETVKLLSRKSKKQAN